jgi:hypothetical protein
MVLRGCIAFLILSSLVCTARAADAPQASHPCAALSKAVERLACYDKAFGPPTGANAEDAGLARESDFGRPERFNAIRDERATGATRINSITAKVAEVRFTQSGQYVFKLENGQIWTETSGQDKLTIEVGDTVTIRRAAMGSFWMVTKDRVGARVRRAN